MCSDSALASINHEPCSVNPSCTSVTCKASNLTGPAQQLTAVFSVGPNCREPAVVFFGLRDRELGTPLFNQSITDCRFSILQQEQVEFTLGPLPEDVENITFSLIQPTNETTLFTLWVCSFVSIDCIMHPCTYVNDSHNSCYALREKCCQIQ